MTLPPNGLSDHEVMNRIEAAGRDDLPWRDGLGWSLVYNASPDHMALVEQAGARYADANGLSHSAFPSIGHFESEVLAIAAQIIHPGVDSFGIFASGGTESILLAMKAYRDTAEPGRNEIVVPRTAHPAFGKAAQLLGLTIRIVAVGASRRVDPADIAAVISPATLAIGVSAPNFPFGVVDPIAEVAAIAQERGVGLHVDAAVGGLFLPFVAGWSRPFGLGVPGVTSISVDLHKYGYGPKGASALMFATNELRHGAYYVDTGWPGGTLAAATIAGTRSGRASAGAYASLLRLGESGLRARVTEVIETTHQLVDGLRALGLPPIVEPDMSVFAATSPTVDVRGVAKGLHERGWWMDLQANPDALHFVVMYRHAEIADRFLKDAAAVVTDPPSSADGDTAGAYGVMVRGGHDGDDELDRLSRYLDRRYDRTT